MLPFWGIRDARAGRSIYFHHTCANAINDFVSRIPDGEDAYAQAVGAYGRSLYSAAASGRPIFLDKTPRYYLLYDLLMQAFPEAKVVILVRNPLAVLASICETFNRGRFRWFDFSVDWHLGHKCLADAIRRPHPNSRVVDYESLVSTPSTVVPDLCRWIGIDFEESMISRYKGAMVEGRMGDPTGIKKYGNVSRDSIKKWQTFFGSKYRRDVAENMLRALDGHDLETLGYPVDNLINALHDAPLESGLDIRSRLDRIIGEAARLVDYRYIQARYRAWRSGDDYAYGYYRKG